MKSEPLQVSAQRVLVVNDELHVTSLLQRVLSSLQDNVVVVTAASGREAIERARTVSFDVVIAEMSMEEMTGLELACLLQFVAPYCKFVLIADYVSELMEDAIHRLQIYECLVKPFSYTKLRQIVGKALQESAEEKRRLGYMRRD